MKNSEIIKMGYVIQDFLLKEKIIDAKPKDLMPLLIKKGFFNQDHKQGLPIRSLLRNLNKRNELYLQVRLDRKEKNVFWFFNVFII